MCGPCARNRTEANGAGPPPPDAECAAGILAIHWRDPNGRLSTALRLPLPGLGRAAAARRSVNRRASPALGA